MDIKYRQFEIVLFLVFVGLALTACIKTSFDGILFLGAFGLFGFVFFIIDHKTQFILNKDSNSFTIVEKALFQKRHKVKQQIKLDDIIGVDIYQQVRFSKEGSSTMYSLHIKTKHNGIINPFNCSVSNKNDYEKFANKINQFLNNDETSLIIDHAPFMFRIIGTIFSLAYINFCLILIFPTYAEKIIPFILEMSGWKKG